MTRHTAAQRHGLADTGLLDDALLLAIARQGGDSAQVALHDRYAHIARRLARRLGHRDRVEQIVTDAVAEVVAQDDPPLDASFRDLLFSAIRRRTLGDEARADTPRVPDTTDARTSPTAAYESLPATWYEVLWHLDVEGRSPEELADLLKVPIDFVPALVYRARAGLHRTRARQTAGLESVGCESVRPLLPALIDRTATMTEQERLHAHLAGCAACMAAHVSYSFTADEVDTLSR